MYVKRKVEIMSFKISNKDFKSEEIEQIFV